jgi:hypothetical protein
MPIRSRTQAIELDVEPTAVVSLLADGARIPEWAPGFADRVAPQANSRWLATRGDNEFDIDIVVNVEAGTVDYVREISPGLSGGLRSRAVPRLGGGTVIAVTLPVLPGAEPDDVAAVLTEELATLAGLIANPSGS